MIIFLSELQKEHLGLLHQHSIQVLVDFCKLAIDYLNNGTNLKKYTVAAEKLNVSLIVVQNLIHALVYLLLEGSKHNLTEPDFRSSLAIAGFSDEQQEVLLRLYCTKKTELSECLNLLREKDPSYQDLNWRFEIQVSSKKSNDEIKPFVAMDFVLMTPKDFSPNKDADSEIVVKRKNKCESPLHINSTIQDAKAASHCLNIVNHVLLECDLPNLVNLTNKLDEALMESKGQHVRKVQRSL